MKKHLLYLSLTAGMLTALGACSGSDTHPVDDADGKESVAKKTPDIKYLPVLNDQAWGIVSLDGKMVCADAFYHEPTLLSNDLVLADKSVYTIAEQPKAVEGLQDLASCGAFAGNDLMPVARANERITLVDNKGHTQHTLGPIGGKEVVQCDAAFRDGILVFKTEDELWGAIDLTGQVVIEPKYNAILEVCDGTCMAFTKSETSPDFQAWLISTSGEVILKIDESYSVLMYSEYGILVSKDGQMGFLSSKGEFDGLPDNVASVGDYNYDYVVFATHDNEVGVMSRQGGEVLIQPKYTGIAMLEGGDKFLTRKYDRCSIVNARGEDPVELDYREVWPVNPNHPTLVAYKAGEYMLVDMDGKLIGENTFKAIGQPHFNYMQVNSDYVDLEGLVSNVVSAISADAIDGVTLGASPATYLAEVPTTWMGDAFVPEKLDAIPQACGFNVSLEATTDSYITSSNYDYGTSDWTYQVNPTAKIVSVSLTISCSKGDKVLDQAKSQIMAALEQKGFQKSGDATSDYETADSYLNIASHYDDLKITLSSKEEPGPEDYTKLVCLTSLTDADVAGCPKDQLRLMRNTIYARHGYIFKDNSLTEHFKQFDWYEPRYVNVAPNELTAIELHNVELIRKYE